MDTPLSTPPLIGLVLAGGLGRRFGHVDKALLPLRGRPLLEHVLDRLTPQLPVVCISANGDLERFAGFGQPVLADVYPDYPGPLAGIASAFQQTTATWILSVAVDLPFLPLDLLQRLQGALPSTSSPGLAVAFSAGQCHYVVALWHRALLGPLRGALEGDNRSLRNWFAQRPHCQVSFGAREGQPDPFFNINQPADLQRAEAILAQQQGSSPPGGALFSRQQRC
ncbi:MAG: molybdenum cofactor guanylyltransferase [Magnetococcales bacterium]|nr:molybdenum cofactor guanylyltransferase [Magnetococcales bacterium]MBF0114342.1 molybdenum cofactor guanylyltransferase [Magnetococcales bacterium]